MADVNVTIGASLDQLSSGVNQAKNVIEEFKTGVQALVGAFAIREMVEFVSHMAELAEQTERTAAILGVSTTAAQGFSTLAKVAGGSSEQLVMSLTRMEGALQRGEKATSQQAAAFRALGLSVTQMQAADPTKQMMLLADAVQRLGNQGINAAPALTLINRGLAQMMPMLQGGSTALQNWLARIKEVATVSPEMTESAAQTAREFTLLKAALDALGETIVGAFGPSLRAMATELSNAAGNLTTLIASGNLMNYIMGWMAGEADLLGARLVQLGIIIANLGGALVGAVKWSEVFTKDMEQADAAAAAATKDLADLNAEFERIKKNFQAGFGGGGLTPAHVDLGLGERQKDAMKQAQLDFQMQMQNIKLLGETYQITQSQMYEAERVASTQRMNAEIKAGENVVTAWKKNAAEIAKINTEETKKLMNDWKQFADMIASDFSNALNQMLSGQKSFSAAMGEMFGKMIEQMIAELVKLIAEWLVLDIVSGGTATFGSVLSQQGGFLGALARALKLQTGTPLVMSSGLAMLHAGEAVIPAWENPMAGGAGGSITNQTFGGTSNITVAVSAIDAHSFGSWLRGGGGRMITEHVSRALQSNPSMRPRYTS